MACETSPRSTMNSHVMNITKLGVTAVTGEARMASCDTTIPVVRNSPTTEQTVQTN